MLVCVVRDVETIVEVRVCAGKATKSVCVAMDTDTTVEVSVRRWTWVMVGLIYRVLVTSAVARGNVDVIVM